MIGLIENTGSPRKEGYLVDLVDTVFKQGGHLQTVLELDYRPQQAAMALSVARALEGDQPQLFEAGTGVGKSLAYLIPGILHAVDSERPFIISSHTITLQEQIRNKDLKICEQLFNAVPELRRYAHFKTALMLGKGNYCCTTRLSNALKEAKSAQTELLPDEGKQDLIRLAKWSAETQSGMVQELAAPTAGRLGHRQCRQFHLLAQKLRFRGLFLSACPQAIDERQLCDCKSQPAFLTHQRRHAAQRRRPGHSACRRLCRAR